MRKVVVHRPGGYERLVLEEHPDPVPGDGETGIEVDAIGVNFADCIVRMGLYSSAKRYVGWPITPGFEVAGRNAATGEQVLAVTRFGGYASRLVVPDRQVFPIPDGWSVEAAAAFPTVFLTAWYAFVRCAAAESGATVLVPSAAGGVGGALLQLARRAGVRAIGVVGASHKAEAAQAAGADEVLIREGGDVWTEADRLVPDGFDAVFESNGVRDLREAYRRVRPTGRLVVYGHASMLPRGGGRRPGPIGLLWRWLRTPRFDPLRMTGENRSVMAFNLSYLFDEQRVLVRAMDELLGWAAAGEIRPPEVTSYPLDRVADAHRDLQSGETSGKLVLRP